ncbi:hypothetical protein HanOQP8_Chr03g0085981 [Helianthus annuus]|nr:hypothetical protein HanOQP8_Chr03g0085981 [Helianthus annuus]
MGETQVVLDTQKDGLYNKHVESPKHDPNISGEKKDLSQKVNTNPSVNVDIKSHDNYNMICSSPHLPTNEAAEEGEIPRDFMDVMPEIDTKSVGETETNPEPRDSICTKTGLKDDSNIIPLFTEAVKDGGIDAAGVVNKTTRNLVDYSEIAVHAKSHESAKQATLKVNATKNQDQVHLVKVSVLLTILLEFSTDYIAMRIWMVVHWVRKGNMWYGLGSVALSGNTFLQNLFLYYINN